MCMVRNPSQENERKKRKREQKVVLGMEEAKIKDKNGGKRGIHCEG